MANRAERRRSPSRKRRQRVSVDYWPLQNEWVINGGGLDVAELYVFLRRAAAEVARELQKTMPALALPSLAETAQINSGEVAPAIAIARR